MWVSHGDTHINTWNCENKYKRSNQKQTTKGFTFLEVSMPLRADRVCGLLQEELSETSPKALQDQEPTEGWWNPLASPGLGVVPH